MGIGKYVGTILIANFVLVGAWAFTTFRFKGDVEEVVIPSGDVTLAGLLVTPGVSTPHDVVVLLHGSGPLPADGPPVRSMANALLESGVGLLSYDKHGVGGSGGTFDRNAYDDFVADAVNAVTYLRSRPDVGTIGLLGSSEGSMIAPEVAVRSGEVGFIINRVGVAVPGIDTNLWQVRHEQLQRGVTGVLLEDTLDLLRSVYQAQAATAQDPSLRDGQAWRDVDAQIARFNDTYSDDPVWIENGMRFGEKLADWDEFFGSARTAITYDPQPFLRQLDIPMLYIFAGDDENVPTAASVGFLESLPSTRVDITVIENVDHTMFSLWGMWRGGFDPGFLDAIGPWAADRIREMERLERRR